MTLFFLWLGTTVFLSVSTLAALDANRARRRATRYGF